MNNDSPLKIFLDSRNFSPIERIVIERSLRWLIDLQEKAKEAYPKTEQILDYSRWIIGDKES